MAESKITDRLLGAIDSLRGNESEFTSLGVSGIKHEHKSIPDLGQQNYGQSMFRFGGWGWNRSRTGEVDYRHEVGDLDGNSLAMAVVNFTSQRIPEAKPVVIKRNKSGSGDDEKDYGHPMASLIRRPNKHHIWANYAAACSMSWWFSGNVYFYKSRDMTGQVQELWYLPHFLVTPRWPNDRKSPEVPADKNNDPFLSHYEYRAPGKEPQLYPAADIVHLKRGVDLGSPRLGLGAFEPLFKEIYGDDKMALFTASIMANMGIQVPIISPKDKDVTVSETKAEHMKQSWMQKTTGSRAGEPVILAEAVDVEKFGFNPTELDLSNLRLIPESRVCAVCQISPAALMLMVGIQNGTSYASSEQARQQGYEEVIIPIQRAWEEEFTWQLLPDFEGSEGAEFVFDTSKVRVLEEDRDALYRRATSALQAGGISRNQFAASLGKPAVDSEEIFYVPGIANVMTQERIEETAKGEVEAPPPPDPTMQEIAKMADIDRAIAYLNEQADRFMNGNTR